MADKKVFKKKKIKSYSTIVLCLTVFIILYTLSNIETSLSKFIFKNNGFDIETDFVKIIDVGQGDSILIYSNGYSALIDVGLSSAGADVCSALDDCEIDSLDVLIISHMDNDHIGGLDTVISAFDVKNLIIPAFSIESEGLSTSQKAINSVTSKGGNVFGAVQGMNFEIGEFELTVLASYDKFDDENNRSTIIMAEIDGLKFLFTGDCETKAEKELLKEGLNLNCDVLKVGHHGSGTSGSYEFLKVTTPKYSAISVGKNNSYGHPHGEVLSNLEYIGSRIYRTDLDGDIYFYVENGRLRPKTEK